MTAGTPWPGETAQSRPARQTRQSAHCRLHHAPPGSRSRVAAHAAATVRRMTGHHQAQAGKQRHHVDGKGHEERDSASPSPKTLPCSGCRTGRQTGWQPAQNHWRAQLPDHGKPAAPLLGALIASSEGRPSQVPPKRQALANAQDDQRRWPCCHRGHSWAKTPCPPCKRPAGTTPA